MHEKPNIGSLGDRAGDHGSGAGTHGFIDLAEAKTFRDMEHRLAALLRKRLGPSENGGPLTAAQIAEETELRALISKRAGEFVCPPGYGPGDAAKDSNRLHQLNCKRLSPPSCGGGNLKGAEDEEEAILTAKLAAYQKSPEGSDRQRLFKLTLQEIGQGISVAEQDELNRLKANYPKHLQTAP
ncbi:MAG: hypothetical protein Q7T45_09120 [Bradyrhizobium sp.]|uniref:hypothetical protein n=1 Tax=Bradyrhizobium sp. TaxID=376 RepID=UPI002725955B|nr:hypothetical protein [Bradyrhizobium sp.]MDO8397970.1 hypothetical protein [Bradyrhizobium sp.]